MKRIPVFVVTIALLLALSVPAFSQGWNVELVGSCYNLWDLPKSLVVCGNYAYVVSHESGLRIVDISDPNDPVEVGYCNTTGKANNVAVSGDVAYVGNWQDDSLYIIDISEPESPYISTTVILPRFPSNMNTLGDYLYITVGSEGLLIFDISNPIQPTNINTYITGDYAQDVIAVGDYAYLTSSSGLHVLDISDPFNIFQTGIDSSVTDAGQIVVSGEYAYITGQSGRLMVVNISNPSNPYLIGSCNTSGQNRGIDASGTNVFIAFDYGMVGGPNHGGLIVIDASDPYNPYEAIIYSMPSTSTDVTIVDNTAFVTNWSSGLHVIDISTPIDPEEIGRFDSPSPIKDIATTSNYAFTALGTELRILDVSNPSAPYEIGIYPITSSYSTSEPITVITISDHFLYVGYSNYCSFGGILSIDISDPHNLLEIGRNESDFMIVEELIIFDNLGYANTGGAITIMNMSNPSSIEVISVCDASDEMIRDIAVSTDQNYIYIAALTKMPIVDISDPNNPFVAALYDPIGSTYGAAYFDHYVYFTLRYSDTTNFVVFDVSDPINPQEVGSCEIPGPAGEIEVCGYYAFLADGSAGIRVIDVSNPSNPTETGYYDTPGVAIGMEICDSYAYVNDRYFFEILDVSQAIPSPQPPKIPNTFYLHPAYPNPFNQSATLSFSILIGTNVSLKVYDVTGRHVTTLVNGWRDLGTYHPLFDASDLASGVYFYRLETPTVSNTRKVVLLK